MVMRRVLLFIMMAALSLGMCALCVAEDVKLAFDGREWEMGYGAENETQTLSEFVLKGETVESWTELVTLQKLGGLVGKTTPRAFMEEMVAKLRSMCPDVKTGVIAESASEITFDWEIASCPGQVPQYEIDRIVFGREAVFFIHYATKKVPVAEKTREEWKKLLAAAAVVE